MAQFIRLSDAEFEVMRIVWENESPVSSKTISKELEEKNWKPQTILTLLARLVNKEFLKCEKVNNKNVYYPQIEENHYLEYETNEFVRKYHNNSVKGLVNTLSNVKELSNDEIDDLKKYLDDLVK